MQKKNSLFQQLLSESRLLTVLYDNLPVDIKISRLYGKVIAYLEKYSSFNNITVDNAVAFYDNYIATYNKHCKQFVKSAKYPFEDGGHNYLISRQEYDVVLLLSVLFTLHRFRIMQLIDQQTPAEKALFIGLGPGLEMLLSKEKYNEMYAYDLSINEFLFSEFPGIFMNTQLYTGQQKNYFDAIYIVELLEHLKDPFALLELSSYSLKKGGHVFLTTATNIPQFDHLYNFPKDHTDFEVQLRQLGFEVVYKEMIPHNYLTMDFNPCNHFYTIKKS